MSTSTSSPTTERFKLIFTVPHSHLEEVKNAIFDVGAGKYAEGKYTRVCFEMAGVGQFRPEADKGANPFSGTSGIVERVHEMRVEILCVGRGVVKDAADALKR